MIPTEALGGTQSEREVFEAIRDGLPDPWTAIHSLGLVKQPNKPWTETDFVIIGEVGVFCIEVKGGSRVERQGGQWIYTDGTGRTVVRNESPFEQVGPSSAVLRSYLVDTDPQLRNIAVGYGVAFPYIKFTAEGPDLLPEVVYDESDHERPFAEYCNRLSAYWDERLAALRGGHRPRRLTPTDIERISDLLIGDFAIRESLASRLRRVEHDLIRLTTEQQRVLGDIENERAIIRGGAGAGKTVLALETAVQAARAGKEVFLTCFSRKLGDRLQAVTADIDGITATSLHHFMHEVLDRTDLLATLPPSDINHRLKVEYPSATGQALLDLEMTGTFDLLVVDEGQDLLAPGYLDVFDQLLDGGLSSAEWRIFIDPNQDIFDQANPTGLSRLSMGAPARFKLSVNCRNTRQIATSAAILSGLTLGQVLRADGPDVDYIWWSNEADQRRKVSRALARILSEGVPPEEITVLSRYRLENSGLALGLDAAVPFKLSADGGPDAIEFATTSGFKGLENTVVVIIDVDNLADPERRGEMYVAATRARSLMVVSAAEGTRRDYLEAAAQFGAAHLR